jgi:antitoxin (DNA-binding transcriptional repressor) of toxin-antitoxin stability system
MMSTVEVVEAESKLPRWVAALERGEASGVVITRNGRPVARLLPAHAPSSAQRIGVAKGAFEVPNQAEGGDRERARLFGVDPD